jgi:DNA-binding CsgD family transcriptional regulator
VTRPFTETKVLSKAEKKVLDIKMQGKSNKEIAFMPEPIRVC